MTLHFVARSVQVALVMIGLLLGRSLFDRVPESSLILFGFIGMMVVAAVVLGLLGRAGKWISFLFGVLLLVLFGASMVFDSTHASEELQPIRAAYFGSLVAVGVLGVMTVFVALFGSRRASRNSSMSPVWMRLTPIVAGVLLAMMLWNTALFESIRADQLLGRALRSYRDGGAKGMARSEALLEGARQKQLDELYDSGSGSDDPMVSQGLRIAYDELSANSPVPKRRVQSVVVVYDILPDLDMGELRTLARASQEYWKEAREELAYREREAR